MYFNTPLQRNQWAMQSIERAITYGIDFNPRGAYDVIKKAWPAYRNLFRGSEETEAEKQAMYSFVLARAKESQNPSQFVTNFLAQIPATATSHLTYLKTT